MEVVVNGFFKSSEVQSERSAGMVPKCGACGLFKRCESPKMEPYGKGHAGVLVVGEAPGQTEDEEGRPFVGKAGQFLRDVLRDIDVNLDRDAWTTNALICRPPNNATPDAKQIGYCRPNVLNVVRQHQPRVVVTLGRSALVSVLAGDWKDDMGVLERWVGWQIPLARHWVCPTYHPSYLLRVKNRILDRLFQEHLAAAFAIDEEPPPLEDVESKVRLIYDDVVAANAIAEFDRTDDWVAVDYEGTCLKPEWPKGKIVSCALSNGKQTISYPWVGEAIEATGKLLRSPRCYKLASNLKMEERWTRKMFGHGVRRWGWDTMLASHCLDNRPGICSLKFQSLVKLGVSRYNVNVEPYLMSHRGPYNRIHEIKLPTLLLYGGCDALYEHRLAMKQRKEIGYAR